MIHLSAMTAERPTSVRAADLLVATAASIAAFALVVAVFAPRLVLWEFTDLEFEEYDPSEIKRAIDALRQLENPFVRITSASNRVINWRLLFPIIGHYLHLPRWAFLSLPAIGCLLVLGYVAVLIGREARSWWPAIAASVLVATTSWFFVSTGWLAYFDSWYVLGLLVAAFAPSKIAASLACLLTPWVDERFVITLPLVVVVRDIYFRTNETGPRARLRSDGLLFFLLVAPYCVVRLLALVTTQDPGSAIHLREHLATKHDPWLLAFGLWAGLRALWVFVVLAPILLVAKGRPAAAALFVLATAVSLALNVPLAHDLSRSASTMVPAAVLGIVLLVRWRPGFAIWPLATALAFNLFTPAWHVIEGWSHPGRILTIFTELDRLKHPPTQLTGLYLRRASSLAKQGKLASALAEAETAIRVGPGSITAQIERARILDQLGRASEAAAGFDTAVRLAPEKLEVYALRSRFRYAHGDLTGAEEDLVQAISLSPPGSPRRAALEQTLGRVRRAKGGQ